MTSSTAGGPLLHRILEHPLAFKLNQMINPWTVGTYENFVRTKVAHGPDTRILDIGCGVGAHRALLMPCGYTGIDINPAYIANANLRFGGGFQVMDAGAMTFADQSFDTVVSVATCHHLPDGIIRAMIAQAMRVLVPGGRLHIVDPVLPINPDHKFKRWLFEHDRGQFQRTLGQIQALLASAARVVDEEIRLGPMHDVCYTALTQ